VAIHRRIQVTAKGVWIPIARVPRSFSVCSHLSKSEAMCSDSSHYTLHFTILSDHRLPEMRESTKIRRRAGTLPPNPPKPLVLLLARSFPDRYILCVLPQVLAADANAKQHWKEPTMLVLSRQRDESIVIGDNIVITIVDIRGDKVRLGIEAPGEVPVHRQEVFEAIQRENRKQGPSQPSGVASNASADGSGR
jgi:carbon storage regulator